MENIPVLRPCRAVQWLMPTLLLACSPVHADCNDQDRQIVSEMAEQVAQGDDERIRLLLIERPGAGCSVYPVWLELGALQMEREQYQQAIYAFEHAVDFQAAVGTDLTPNQLLRRAIANARLGEAYHAADDLVMALVATQEALRAFDQLSLSVPRRLEHLQAKLDDALSRAEATVMARALEIQQDRADRGVGPPTPLQDAEENRVQVAESLQLLSNFSGDPVLTVEESGIAFVADTQAIGENTTQATAPGTQRRASLASSEAGELASAARLNIPVLFQSGSTRLTEESLGTIAELASALSQLDLTSQDTVTVVGHTDALGEEAFNMQLSRERAEVVATALSTSLQQWAPVAFSLEYQGRGETELRYQGDDEEDHRRNRRVELIVRKR